MIRYYSSICFTLLLLAFATKVQAGSISGRTLQSNSKTPVEYATIAVYKAQDSTLVSGAVSNENGFFRVANLEVGTYYLKVSFIGYKPKFTDLVNVTEQTPDVRIPPIKLASNAKDLKAVEITSTVSSMEYQIDKKVVNVSKNLTAVSGTAVEILENVPSVQVDIDGSVSLRGSSSFQVLINGRPSILDPTDALNQIPASSIEQVEIITNPSAKYDPDSQSGIINIITKKNRQDGVSGQVNLNAGNFGNYGGDAILYYRKKKINYFLGGNYNDRTFPGISEERRTTINNDTVSYIQSEGDTEWHRFTYNINGGVELEVSKKDQASIKLDHGYRTFDNASELDFLEFDNQSNNRNQFLSINEALRGGDYYSAAFDWHHEFDSRKHYLSGQLMYDYRNMNEEITTEQFNPDGSLANGQFNIERGPSERWRMRIDYARPIGEKSKFETGLQARLGESRDTTKFWTFNPATDSYEFQNQFANLTKYERDIYSVYAIFGGELDKLGYQIGYRMEYTDRTVSQPDSGLSLTLNRPDHFPSVHFSYKLPKDQQFMTSYTRRIERPRSWHFEPFVTWVDAFNVRSGNPNLDPEYIDSYEAGYTKQFNKNQFSLEGYYRVTHNKIERVQSVYAPNVVITNFENVGNDYSLGFEAVYSTDLLKWWNVDLMGNFFYYKVTGQLQDVSFDNESNNWNVRLNNTFYIAKEWQFQVNGNYTGPTATAQGIMEEYYAIHMALKKQFFEKKLSVVLQGRDVFQTLYLKSESFGPGFQNYRMRRRTSPIMSITVGYKINNFKPKRRSRTNDDNDDF